MEFSRLHSSVQNMEISLSHFSVPNSPVTLILPAGHTRLTGPKTHFFEKTHKTRFQQQQNALCSGKKSPAGIPLGNR